MALLTWERKYSVGVDAMDAQHQKWIGILNRLHDAMLTGKAKEMQLSILAEMVAYTRTHFLQEELLGSIPSCWNTGKNMRPARSKCRTWRRSCLRRPRC
jgi:hypothetical protein